MTGTDLLSNLVASLTAALIGGWLAVRLGQSAILGYIVAGMAIGPSTPGFVGDPRAVEVLADIGIIFLMFAIGVQFSLSELVSFGRVALAGALTQVVLTLGAGYLIGTALGWGGLEALFFGAVLSNSSSTVLGKVLDERGEADSEHGRLALAWSAVQDLTTIVLVVVLGTLATSREQLGPQLALAAVKALLFLAALVPLGARALPWLFERTALLRSREVFVLLVASVALLTAYLASWFGLSLALGAFLAGLVVGESDLSHQILGEVMPVRDLFAALFFVSVGMLVDPAFGLANLGLVVLVVALILGFKGALCALLVGAARYPVRVAVLAGGALAQCGEFSFLLARLGAELHVLSPAVFSLLLAGAAVSIVLAPGLHAAAPQVAARLERRLPPGPLGVLARPERHQLRGHAILCGHGRVGRVIAATLRQRGLPFVVVEQDPRHVRRLRAVGIPALLGNAANPLLLDQTNLEQARVLIVALPDPLATRQIVDHARQRNPDLDIVARTHSTVEAAFLLQRGVSEVVHGELELALEMTRHTLRRFGVGALEALALVQGLRARLEHGAAEEELG
jgi:CPA2 family monovalent cation:H+ antiporter-2